MAEQNVTLEPGESKLVSFEAIPHEARTYQVVVDGLSGSFSAVAPPPPPLDITAFLDVVLSSTVRTLDDYYSYITASKISHLGFRINNAGESNVSGVSVKASVINLTLGGTVNLTPPYNSYLQLLTQPFAVAPGDMDIFFGHRLTIYAIEVDYELNAEVYVAGELVATKSQNFTVEGMLLPPYP